MNRYTLPFLVSLSACGSPIEGTWVLQRGAPEIEQQTEVSHNFVGASPAQDDPYDDGWEYEVTPGDNLLSVRIVGADGDNAFLEVDSRLLPGVREGGGWRFEWADTVTAHSGLPTEPYYYAYDEVWSDVTSVWLELKGGTAEGTITHTVSDDIAWTEPDAWSSGEYSYMPTYNFLEGGAWGYPYNDSQLDDCTGDECELAVTATAQEAWKFSGTRVDLDEDASPFESGEADTGYYY